MSEHVLTDDQAQAYIDAGTKAWELVRHRFPDLTEEQCHWVLWERTPFPLATGVHDIVDAVHRFDPNRCGEMTWKWGEVCQRKVPSLGVPCYQHRIGMPA